MDTVITTSGNLRFNLTQFMADVEQAHEAHIAVLHEKIEVLEWVSDFVLRTMEKRDGICSDEIEWLERELAAETWYLEMQKEIFSDGMQSLYEELQDCQQSNAASMMENAKLTALLDRLARAEQEKTDVLNVHNADRMAGRGEKGL